MNLVHQSQSICGLGSAAAPVQAFHHLDSLWIQVAGTRCNLRCAHCFVSAGPDGRRPMMSRDAVAGRVREAIEVGVREFYFTGGEPFLHPEMLAILADTLPHGPCTVLTHGLLLQAARIQALRALSERSRYSLELRVSLDAPRAEDHDRVRGRGTFARALAALRACQEHGLLPIVTVTHDLGEDPLAAQAPYLELLAREGIARPRLKAIPLFRLGREAERSGGPDAAELLAGLPGELTDDRLQCARSRAVSHSGVHVCPLLVEEPEGRLDGGLRDNLGPVSLLHAACATCHATGMTCGNA